VSSKSGMLGLSMASATELVEHGITVNTLLPGGVMTPGGMSAVRPDLPPEKFPPRPPMGMNSPRDIGAAVLFFASPAAHKITNQVVGLDAGFSVVL
jgi:NAD(P)-dependent dehydrogenase (short-subunit alcohol dehydrogenase family)